MYFLMHDRDIARRVDDSVVRVRGRHGRGSCGAPAAMRRRRLLLPEVRRRARRCLPGRRTERRLLPAARMARRSCRITSATWKTPRRSPTTRALGAVSAAVRARAAGRRGRPPSGISVAQARPRLAATTCADPGRSAAPSRPCRRLPRRKRRRRSMRRRCSASRSTGWATATTARSGAANSCWPIIAAIRRLGDVQAGGDAGRRASDPRAVAQTLRASDGEIGWERFSDGLLPVLELYRFLIASRRAPCSTDDRARRQQPAGKFLRPSVRRGGGGARRVPRTRAIRRAGRGRIRGAGRPATRCATKTTRLRIRSRFPTRAGRLALYGTAGRCGMRCSAI